MHRWHQVITLVLVFAAGETAIAAHISEVFLGAFAGGPGPNAVELDGLWGLAQVDLVVIDATALRSRYGEVLQVVPLSLDGAQSTILLSESAWPDGLWNRPAPPPDTSILLSDLGCDGFRFPSLAFAEARTVLLFGERTGLVAGGGTLVSQLGESGVKPLDWLTFSEDGRATAFAGESVLNTATGHAVARPRAKGGVPSELLLIDRVDESAALATVSPIFYVTPGLTNPVWEPLHMPEPTSAAGMVLLLAVLGRGRQIVRPTVRAYHV